MTTLVYAVANHKGGVGKTTLNSGGQSSRPAQRHGARNGNSIAGNRRARVAQQNGAALKGVSVHDLGTRPVGRG